MSNDISKKESREMLKGYAKGFDVPYGRVLKLYHIYRKDGLSREESVDAVYDRLASLIDDIHRSAEALETSVEWASKVIGDKAALEHYRSHTRNTLNKIKKHLNTNWEVEEDKWDYDDKDEYWEM